MDGMTQRSIEGLAALDADAIAWKRTQVEGVFWLPLHLAGEGPEAASTVLIRMDPGRGYPRHEHLGVEEVLCLRGGYTDELGTVRAGDYVRYEAGSAHAPIALDGEACILYAIAHGGIRLADEADGPARG